MGSACNTFLVEGGGIGNMHTFLETLLSRFILYIIEVSPARAKTISSRFGMIIF